MSRIPQDLQYAVKTTSRFSLLAKNEIAKEQRGLSRKSIPQQKASHERWSKQKIDGYLWPQSFFTLKSLNDQFRVFNLTKYALLKSKSVKDGPSNPPQPHTSYMGESHVNSSQPYLPPHPRSAKKNYKDTLNNQRKIDLNVKPFHVAPSTFITRKSKRHGANVKKRGFSQYGLALAKIYSFSLTG